MSGKHLTVGSECPPYTEGVLRCYGMKFCPFTQRARLVLKAKDVKHEVMYINLSKKPEWFIEKNPLQKVPVLERDGDLMFESLVTCDYIDEAYPEPALHSKDPWQKGQDRMYMELFCKVSSAMYQVYKSHSAGNEDEVASAFENIANGLDTIETELAKRGSQFFGGDRPGMLDYMIWPWSERLPAVEIMAKKKFDASRFSKFMSWMNTMLEDKVVKAICIPPEVHKKFLDGYFAGSPDYDMEY